MTKEAVFGNGNQERGAGSARAGRLRAARRSPRDVPLPARCVSRRALLSTRDRLCLLLDARSYSCFQCCNATYRSAIIYSDLVI